MPQVADNAPTDSDALWTAQVEAALRVYVPEGQDITFEAFQAVISNGKTRKEGSFQERLIRRFFSIFDKDCSGQLSLDEFMTGLKTITRGSVVEKMEFLFSVYDLDGNGEMDISEFREIITAGLSESKIELKDEDVDKLIETLMGTLDKDKSGCVTWAEFKKHMAEHPEDFGSMKISVASCLEPKDKRKKTTKKKKKTSIVGILRNNYRLIIFAVLFFLINAALFIYSAYSYRDSNGYVIVARGCGMCLNFDCPFLIILVLRYFLTWLRSTVLSRVLPLDNHISIHKAVALLVLILGLVHSCMHFGNFYELTKTTNYTYTEYLLTTTPGLGWVYGTASLSGLLILLVMAVMYSLSLSCVRRSGQFEAFYFGHHLFIVFYILLFIHGSRFWYFLIAPFVLYIVERVMRSPAIIKAKYGNMVVKEGIILPSKVTQLVISRPRNFNFRSGEYVFVCIPAITAWEWHPFTISSAPEMKDAVWLHIRAVGHWTKKLHEYFSKATAIIEQQNKEEEERPKGERSLWNNKLQERMVTASSHDNMSSRLSRYMSSLKAASAATADDDTLAVPRRRKAQLQSLAAVSAFGGKKVTGAAGPDEKASEKSATAVAIQMDPSESRGNGKAGGGDNPDADKMTGMLLRNIPIYIEGPYGAPAEDIWNSEHAVLVATGIGVTPFASILQSVMYRLRAVHHRCPSCENKWTTDDPDNALPLKKVTMIWVNREQKMFEWFVGLLRELELDQKDFMNEGEDERLEFLLYLTSALQNSDMRAFGLSMALSMHRKQGGQDVITGLKSKTYMGRPNWPEVFTNIKDQNKGRVTVFFCGAPVLAKQLQGFCDQYSFMFKKEEF